MESLEEAVVHETRRLVDRYNVRLALLNSFPVTWGVYSSPWLLCLFPMRRVALPLATLWTLMAVGYTRRTTPYEQAKRIQACPGWAALCATVQGKREALQDGLSLEPMEKDTVGWKEMVAENKRNIERLPGWNFDEKVQAISFRGVEFLLQEENSE